MNNGLQNGTICYQGLDRLEVYAEGKMDESLFNEFLEKRDVARKTSQPVVCPVTGGVVHPGQSGQHFHVRLSFMENQVSIKVGSFKEREVQKTEHHEVKDRSSGATTHHIGTVSTGRKVSHRCKIDFHGRICRQFQVSELVALANTYLDTVLSEGREAATITRMDLATDTTAAFNPDDQVGLVSRSKNREFHTSQRHQGETFTGFVVGRDKIMLRLYNKTEELKKTKKLQEYPEQYQNGVWRVEYQVRKPKNLGVQTLDQLPERIAGVWKYLTRKWCRFTTPELTRSGRIARKTRWSTDPRWKTVQAFGSFGKFRLEVCRKKRYAAPVSSLVDQAMGCLVKAVVLESYSNDSFVTKQRVLDMVYNRLRGKNDVKYILPSFAPDGVWSDTVERKQNELCLNQADLFVVTGRNKATARNKSWNDTWPLSPTNARDGQDFRPTGSLRLL